MSHADADFWIAVGIIADVLVVANTAMVASYGRFWLVLSAALLRQDTSKRIKFWFITTSAYVSTFNLLMPSFVAVVALLSLGSRTDVIDPGLATSLAGGSFVATLLYVVVAPLNGREQRKAMIGR